MISEDLLFHKMLIKMIANTRQAWSVFAFVNAAKMTFSDIFPDPTTWHPPEMEAEGAFNTKAHFLASLLFQLIQEDQQQDLLAHVHV